MSGHYRYEIRDQYGVVVENSLTKHSDDQEALDRLGYSRLRPGETEYLFRPDAAEAFAAKDGATYEIRSLIGDPQ